MVGENQSERRMKYFLSTVLAVTFMVFAFAQSTTDTTRDFRPYILDHTFFGRVLTLYSLVFNQCHWEGRNS
jgi:hypothetical protein